MRNPSNQYLYGRTSSFGVSVNVSKEAESAIDAEIRLAQQDQAHEQSLRQKRRAFHALLVDPRTSARLDAMLAECARIDAATAGPVVEVVIVPDPDAPRGPVIDVTLEPKPDGGDQ